MANLQLLKLSSGEVILGDVKNVIGVDNVIEVSSPIEVSLVPTGNEQQPIAVSIMPYAVFTEDKKLDVQLDHVIWTAEPSVGLKNQWNAVFGNGLILPDTSLATAAPVIDIVKS